MNKSSLLSSNQTLRRKPQQKRGQQRVEKILLAASEVFAKVGFAAATIQQIADQSNTAVGSIYQFFPDKLSIFQALLQENRQQTKIFEEEFLKGDVNTPLIQLINKYVDSYASYSQQSIPRCIVAHLQMLEELLTDQTTDLTDGLSNLIENHANLYRQRNPNLSVAKSKWLSEVFQYMCTILLTRVVQSDEEQRQELYAEVKNILYCYLNPYIGDHLFPSHNQKMVCPNCQSNQLAKNGHQQGKQRYTCKGCGRQFINQYTARGYPLETKQQCLDLHQQGMSFREIERQTGVNHNTVINWVKNI
jgi:AcrR family transcriptional regulator